MKKILVHCVIRKKMFYWTIVLKTNIIVINESIGKLLLKGSWALLKLCRTV